MLEGTIKKLWGFKINFGFKHKRTLFVLISDVWYQFLTFYSFMLGKTIITSSKFEDIEWWNHWLTKRTVGCFCFLSFLGSVLIYIFSYLIQGGSPPCLIWILSLSSFFAAFLPKFIFLSSMCTNKVASKPQDSLIALINVHMYQSFYAACDMSLYTSTFSWWLQRIQRILTDNWECIKSF